MKPADVAIAVLVAVIWGLGFVASRFALDLFAWLCLCSAVPLFGLFMVTVGPEEAWRALAHMSLRGVVSMLFVGGIAIMLFSKRPQALPKAAGA